MPNTFIKGIDRLMWLPVADLPVGHSTGSSIASDLRSDVSRDPYVYYFYVTTSLYRFNTVTKGWDYRINPSVSGSNTNGMSAAFAPSGAWAQSITGGAADHVVMPAYPASLGNNSLANRGGSGEYGYKIRLVGKTSGKTEERFVVANTGGAGIGAKIYVNEPFTFTPQSGDMLELLSGQVFLISGSSANFRTFNPAFGYVTSLSLASGPSTTGNDTSIAVLDEQYTPYDCHPGEGMIKGGYLYDSGLVDRYALEATGSSSTTLTGQATGGDNHVVANEYRNFQIRIVEDTTTPAAVGQRRIISDHTAGPSPVYTLGSSWSTTPSANAKYVIELPNLLLVRTSSVSTLYAYNYGYQNYINSSINIAPNGWSTSFTNGPTTNQLGSMWAPSWGIRPDPDKNARHSHFYFFRSGSVATLDMFDFSAFPTGSWASNVIYDGNGETMFQGCSAVLDPISNEGRMVYISRYQAGAANQVKRFDVQNRTMAPFLAPDIRGTSSGTSGQRLAAVAAFNGNDTYTNLYMVYPSTTTFQELTVLT